MQSTQTANSTLKCSNNDIEDFVILKNFSTIMHPFKVILCKEVICCPPSYSWVKVNTNDASCGTPILAACEGIFRDNDGNHF